MMDIINFKAIQQSFETGILVVGGGSAGCLAALAAARQNKYPVALAERYGFPGGTSTQMLDTFYGFFTPGEHPRKIVGGLPDLVVDELDKTGNIFLRPNTYGAGTGVNYNPERLKQVWDALLTGNNVRLFYHSMLVAVEQEGEQTACVFFHKGEGFFKIRAKRVIDASGDADYCFHAGLPFEKAGELEPAQSMTTTFRMCNVNLQEFKNAGGKQMLKEKMTRAFENKTYLLPRKEGSAHEMCQPGCISTVAVKVAGLDALKVGELTQAEIEGRKQAFEYERFFRGEVPGFKNAKIIGLSHQTGIRETRRVYGLHRLTREECLAGQIPGSSVLLCGAPIEDHRMGKEGEDETRWEYIPGTGVYGVPYGTIVPQKSTTTWVAGRCFSATHDAHASCRSMAQTMGMGQAAGLAAVLSLENDCSATGVPVNRLREQLAALGAVLEIPVKVADTGRNGWKNNRKKNK
jgi:hypothetical protein